MGTKIPITEIKTKLQIAVKQAKESNLELECDYEYSGHLNGEIEMIFKIRGRNR